MRYLHKNSTLPSGYEPCKLFKMATLCKQSLNPDHNDYEISSQSFENLYPDLYKRNLLFKFYKKLTCFP
jgi:hypothetical protein